MGVTEELNCDDALGRSVGSTKEAQQARRGNFRLNRFLPKRGEIDLSVDRIDSRWIDSGRLIAESREHSRGKSFHGWVVVSVKIVRRIGLEVNPSPIEGNPFHADIKYALEDRDDQKLQARILASHASWFDSSQAHAPC